MEDVHLQTPVQGRAEQQRFAGSKTHFVGMTLQVLSVVHLTRANSIAVKVGRHKSAAGNNTEAYSQKRLQNSTAARN